MRLFLAFLFTAFMVGGTTIGRPFLRKPLYTLLGCVVVGSMFYSYRFIS